MFSDNNMQMCDVEKLTINVKEKTKTTYNPTTQK